MHPVRPCRRWVKGALEEASDPSTPTANLPGLPAPKPLAHLSALEGIKARLDANTIAHCQVGQASLWHGRGRLCLCLSAGFCCTSATPARCEWMDVLGWQARACWAVWVLGGRQRGPRTLRHAGLKAGWGGLTAD